MDVRFQTSSVPYDPIDHVGQPIAINAPDQANEEAVPAVLNQTTIGTIVTTHMLATGILQPATLQDLASSMVGQSSTTCGWDVVCSYDRTKLNEILQVQFKNNNNLTNITLGDVDTPYSIEYSTMIFGNQNLLNMIINSTFIFNLNYPVLSFTDDNHASLIMSINSAEQNAYNLGLVLLSDEEQNEMDASLTENIWYKKDSNGAYSEIKYSDLFNASNDEINNIYIKVSADKVNDPLYNDKWLNLNSVRNNSNNPLNGEQYQLQAIVPLASVRGEGNQKVYSNDILVFDDGATDNGNVVLQFNTDVGTSTKFNLLDSSGSGADIVKNAPQLLDDLQNYFCTQLKDIDLVLAGVSSITTSSDLVITPKSFVFSAQQLDEKTGCLSLFIQTKESLNPQGMLNPSFAIGQQTAYPIPQDHTATLILSRNMMESYFQNQLSGQGFNLTPSGNYTVPVAFTGTYTPQNSEIDVDTITTDIDYSLILVTDEVSAIEVGTIEIDPYKVDSLAVSTVVNDQKPNTTIELNISGQATKDITVDGSRTVSAGMYGGSTMKFQESHNLTFTVACNKTITLAEAFNDQDLNFGFTIKPEDFSKPTIQSNDKNFPLSGTLGGQIAFNIQSQISNKMPGFSISLQPLNTFVVSNLLFNGNQKFTLDTDAGIEFPIDVVLAGNITE